MRLATLLFFAASLCGLLTYAQERALQPLGDAGANADTDGRNLSLPIPEAGQVSILERDGKWALTVRVSSPGAAGLQLFVENLRLPEGSKLAVYEIGRGSGLSPIAQLNRA